MSARSSKAAPKDERKRVDAYLAKVSPAARKSLEQLRKSIKAAAPGAVDAISYGFPAFRLDGRLLVCYKAAKGHCSFHPMSGQVIAANAASLGEYHTSKGTVRFEHGASLPATLVRKLVKTRIAELED